MQDISWKLCSFQLRMQLWNAVLIVLRIAVIQMKSQKTKKVPATEISLASLDVHAPVIFN